MYTPAQISIAHYWDSPFQNTECEIILCNIVKMQRSANPDDWTPFTWEQYKAFCTHDVGQSERGILNTFVNGGKPVWNTSAYLSSGWLAFDESTGEYNLTDKTIEMLGKKYPA